MRKRECGALCLIVMLVSFVACIAAVVASAVVYFEKRKRDEEDLDVYLDGAIQ